jgi:hypothetical protein
MYAFAVGLTHRRQRSRYPSAFPKMSFSPIHGWDKSSSEDERAGASGAGSSADVPPRPPDNPLVLHEPEVTPRLDSPPCCTTRSVEWAQIVKTMLDTAIQLRKLEQTRAVKLVHQFAGTNSISIGMKVREGQTWDSKAGPPTQDSCTINV